MPRLVLALLVAVGPILAAPVPKDFRRPDAQVIVGKWHVVSVTNDGTPYPSYPKNVFFTFDGEGRFVQTMTGEKNIFRRTYTLDSAATPRRMTLLEPGAVAPQKWVYAVNGDKLEMGCLKGDEVPDAVGPAKGVVLYTLARVPDGK